MQMVVRGALQGVASLQGSDPGDLSRGQLAASSVQVGCFTQHDQ